MQAVVSLLILDMMPIYMIIALDIVMIIRFSINCPTVTHRMLFSREKPLVKTMARGLFSYHMKPKIPCCDFSFFILFCVLVRSIYQISYNLIYLNTDLGLTTPLTRWLASICCLCAGSVYIVLLGSPTGLITLVS